MSRADDRQLAISHRLIGRMDDFRALRELLVEWPGVTVLSSDPWSGASQLLAAVAEHLDAPCVLVDARSSSSPLDLAMEIADTAVSTLGEEAAAWWTDGGPMPSGAGLRLARELSTKHVDLQNLRHGAGEWPDRLTDAIELLLTLADGPVTLFVDHAGLLLSALPPDEARELLGLFRALCQRHTRLDLVLVEHRDGHAASALTDSGHPLFHAGQQVPLRRPNRNRYVLDLRALRLQDDPTYGVLPAAAELACGVPALTWQIAELAGPSMSLDERALDGWTRLKQMAAPSIAREWDLLRRVHPLAQSVVAAIACGLGPHAVNANSKSVTDALRRLRDLGMAWQPGPRSWMLSDPLLTSWVSDHPPPWVTRRRLPAG